jgi:hypothetical protein
MLHNNTLYSKLSLVHHVSLKHQPILARKQFKTSRHVNVSIQSIHKKLCFSAFRPSPNTVDGYEILHHLG